MAKAAKLFVLAEFVYNIAIPAARSRKMISRADPEKVPAGHAAEYRKYQRAVYCFSGSILLVLCVPSLFTLAVAAGLAPCGYYVAEKIYPSLAYHLADILPESGGREAMAAHVAHVMAEKDHPVRTAAGKPALRESTSPKSAPWKNAARPRGEKISGRGPWMVYVIDVEGAERRLPRRFEEERDAQRYAEAQLAASRGQLQHAGVIYAPES